MRFIHYAFIQYYPLPWVRFLFVSQLFYRSIVCLSYSEPNEEEYMDLFMKIRWFIWKLEAKWTRSAWQCTFNKIRDCWLLNRFRWNTYIFLPSRETNEKSTCVFYALIQYSFTSLAIILIYLSIIMNRGHSIIASFIYHHRSNLMAISKKKFLPFNGMK